MTAARVGLATFTFIVSLGLAVPPLSGQGNDPNEGCALCHGELELLRQHTPTLADARRQLVPPGLVQSSAHGEMSCGECHTGYGRFPHPVEGGATESCASCHLPADSAWADGLHATEGEAGCESCHGTHEVLSVERLRTPAGARVMGDTCTSCHLESAHPPGDVHMTDTVSCASCHAPHRTLAPSDPDSWMHPLNQAATCGDCHDSVSVAWDDVHSAAVEELTRPDAAIPEGATSSAPPSCSGCHGSHATIAPSSPAFADEMVAQCSTCHTDAAESFFGTYHGKATALGSEIAATCDACHGAHEVFPSDDDRSMVADAALIETCGACHENVRPAFVEYDSHPNPLDRERNAPLFYSFVFMNVLLAGVLTVFLLHTALWWVRLLIDQSRGVHHGIGEGPPEGDAGHGSGGDHV